MKLLIINGFDRTGSSMMGGVLSNHPDVAFMFQPFSSTEVHKDQFEVWNPKDEHPDTKSFLNGCLNGDIRQDFISAIWFEKYSHLKNIKDKKLNIIKETKMHFKIDWIKANIPEAYFVGIWRDPRGILASLVSNNFHIDWYAKKNTYEKVVALCDQEKELSIFLPFTKTSLDVVQQMAFIEAVSIRYQMNRLQKHDWISYEDVLRDPNTSFNDLLSKIGNFTWFDFSPFMAKDYNPSGSEGVNPFQWKTFFSKTDLNKIEPIFELIDWNNYKEN